MKNALKQLTSNNFLFILFLLSALGIVAVSYFLLTREMATSSFLILALAALSSIGLLFGGYFLFQKKVNPIKVYVGFLITLGLAYMFVFAPQSVPDEKYHFQASYKYANIILGETAEPDAMAMRDIDISFDESTDRTMNKSQYVNVLDNFEIFASNSNSHTIEPVSSFDISSNPPQVKLPSALGIVLAKLLNLGSVPLYYFGRFFNLLCFILLVYFAVRITPIGKIAFMGISLLPMTLHLAASYSYDSVIIGLAMLLCALCLRCAFGTDAVKLKHLVAIGIVSALLAPCKLVYIFLLVLVLIIPQSKFPNKKYCILAKSFILGFALLSLLAFRIITLFDLATATTTILPGEITGTTEGYTINWALEHPFSTISLYLNTFASQGDFYLSTLLGGSLGWFQTEIKASWILIIAFLLLLLLSFLKTKDEVPNISKFQKTLLFCVFLIGTLAVMTSMFLSWTPVDSSTIQGVQGRYLIPFLPLVFLLVRNNTLVVTRRIDEYLLLGFFAFNVINLIEIFGKAVLI